MAPLSFPPKTTSPPDYDTTSTTAPLVFYSGPSGRGTLQIVWSCLSTIILASWSGYHDKAYSPNGDHTNFVQSIKMYIFRILLTLFPEFHAAEFEIAV